MTSRNLHAARSAPARRTGRKRRPAPGAAAGEFCTAPKLGTHVEHSSVDFGSNTPRKAGLLLRAHNGT
jgi:hypothetical protein